MTLDIEVQPGTPRRGTPRKRALGLTRHVVAVATQEHPEGLHFVGSGLYKEAYTDGKFVYKRPQAEYCEEHKNCDDLVRTGYNADNIVDEFEAHEHLNRDGYSWVAPTSLYRVDGVPITVQRYYQHAMEDFDGRQARRIWNTVYGYGMSGVGEDEYNPLAVDQIVGDIHDDNIRCTPKGQVRCIDLSGG